MRTWVRDLGCGLGALLGAWLAVEARGQDVKPAAEGDTEGVHRMVIHNGPHQSVGYFGRGLSQGEMSSLRDLELAENQAEYARTLLAVKRQYVNSEQLLEPQRRFVQEQLYGQAQTMA